jgi:hypothetical protein
MPGQAFHGPASSLITVVTVPTDQPNADAPRRRIAIKADDLQELYLLVQGAPYANTLLDAQVALSQHDLGKTLELIQSARERYRQSHWRTLRHEGDPSTDAPPESRESARARQLLRRCQLVLEAFDDVIATLERMVKLRAGKAPAAVVAAAKAAARLAPPLPAAFRAEYETAHVRRAQLAAIQRHFVVRRVGSENDIERDQLYYLQGREQTYLIVVSASEPNDENVAITLALSGQAMKPLTKARFVELGKKLRLVRLIPQADAGAIDGENLEELWANVLEPDHEVVEAQEHGLLDRGSFSQLQDAAQRSGLVPNSDLIGHTRDREFRLNDYPKAYQLIEGLYGKFCGAATAREQRLRREDLDIAAGKIQMSPKQLLEKRARDIADNQLIDRARRRFLRVLEGLRVMMR